MRVMSHFTRQPATCQRATRPQIVSLCRTLSGFLLLFAGLTGCTAQPQTPILATARPIAATVNIVFVTRTPAPTASVVPTVTPFFDAARLAGNWQFNFTYHLRGYPAFDDIRYSGSVPLKVASDGSLSGTGIFYTALDQPPCSTIVLKNSGLPVSLTGSLINTPQGVLADVQLVPQDAAVQQTFQMICHDAALSKTVAAALLWPALDTLNERRFRIPLAVAAQHSAVRDLTAPSGGLLHGTLSVSVQLSR